MIPTSVRDCAAGLSWAETDDAETVACSCVQDQQTRRQYPDEAVDEAPENMRGLGCLKGAPEQAVDNSTG